MYTVQRKVTYRMYPSAVHLPRMEDRLALHCRVRNTLQEEHERRHEAGEPPFTFTAMCKTLTQWRHEVPALAALNAQSLQVTAKRLHLAFAAFLRRVKAGEESGYPRFKSVARFSGWGYKSYGDGWQLLQPVEANGRVRHGKVRLSGIGEIALRGRGRFVGTPVTAEVQHKAGKWYLSVTHEVTAQAVARVGGSHTGAFDWGLDKLLTLAVEDGDAGARIETLDNPRWLKRRLGALQALQRAVSAEETQAKASIGLAPDAPLPKGTRLPVSGKVKRLYAQVRSLHGKIARQRHDFYHKLTAQLVARFGAIAAEELEPAKMTRRPKKKQDAATGEFLPNGAARKAGLNRAILDAAPALLYRMLATKAAEAGSQFALANTRRVKPTQRCHHCGALVPKALSERLHRCACTVECGRDENAARTLLRWLTEGEFWPGTGQAGTGESLLPPHETPPIATAPAGA